MKTRLFILFAVITITICATAQETTRRMVVTQTNGTKSEISVNTVKDITFRNDEGQGGGDVGNDPSHGMQAGCSGPESYIEVLTQHGTSMPRKPCVSFQMDINSYASISSSQLYDFITIMKEEGLTPTIFAMDSQLVNDDIIEKLKDYQAMGCEIGIHSDPADGMGRGNTADHPDEARFRQIMEKEYLTAFISNGLFPVGWVTSQGALVTELLEPLRDYMAYGHTLSNGGLTSSGTLADPLNFVNTHDTDKMKIKRWGVEKLHDDATHTEQDFIDAAISGINAAIDNNGLFIIYCHSYNNFTNTRYTLTEGVLRGILDYLRPLLHSGKIVGGTTANVVSYYYQ